ncbi:PLP-dependent aminotransferase family protein [Acinetobacter ihumii]|uniref:aminotransferase-like domain-containing protein n=1 Tax=Acinetobacter ihumii TaxID=2483802 RepID=UPI001031DDAF|nr:PLP-dependent aminotransferase family protein [Acinetobacter ihumii]
MTKIERVISHINGQIRSRHLQPGMRLSSVRALAKELNFSISTVVEAYERMASMGIIESRVGSGFFVSTPLEPLMLSHVNSNRDKELDPLHISRQLLEAAPNLIKPGCGWLPDEWMPHESLRKAIRDASKIATFELMNYSSPLGLLNLRELLARRLYTRGIEVNAEQVLLTDSGSYALDLICRFLLKPDDVVLVDDPCYFNFQALLKVHQVKAVGIPFTAYGPDIQAFKHAIHEFQPRLYITNSGIHNPTGATVSHAVAHQLLSLIEQSQMIVVEDDIFADFESTPSPRLSALDNLQNSIYIGSFSKTLSASVRCGYIVTKSEWIDRLIDLKISTSFSHSNFSAQILYKALTDGGYRKHMEQLRLRLSEATRYTIQKLESMGIKPWIVPKAGIFIWCELPKDIDVKKMAAYCAEHQMILALGNSFSQSEKFSQYLRFNVAQCMNPDVFKVLKSALEVAKVKSEHS